MIVIAIIGVLAAIAVPNFQRARRRANTRACYANIKTIAGAIEMYNLDNNLNAALGKDVTLEDLAKDGYLQSVPVCPSTNKSADYLQDGDGICYCKNHGSIQMVDGADKYPTQDAFK